MTSTTRACLQAAHDAYDEAMAAYDMALYRLGRGEGSGEAAEAAFDEMVAARTTLRDKLASAETQGRGA